MIIRDSIPERKGLHPNICILKMKFAAQMLGWSPFLSGMESLFGV